ncbi:MAG: hypothetical protein K1Y02_08375 [Candidatus Hydrogenedentes bacterium]|nr:hypothetical protein [Candidatus Hydrogenedentota bacterium]
MKRLALPVCVLVLVALLALLVLGFIKSPVAAERQRFAVQLEELEPPAYVADNTEADSAAWRNVVTSRTDMWAPLVKAAVQAAPPPNLSSMLAGVQPKRNKMADKIQIIVDGVKGWYGKGQQIKGCTIKDITDAGVVFSLSQAGQEYNVTIPRR